MKRMIAAVLIIVFSMALSLWCSEKVDTTLEEILYTTENDSKKAYDLWQEKKGFLSLLLKHEDINSIDEEMYAMNQYIITDRKEAAEDSRIRIEGFIESIRQGEKLSFSNIF